MTSFIQGNLTTLLPIFAFSVFALAIIIERAIYFYKIKGHPTGLGAALESLDHASGAEIVMLIQERDRSPAAALLKFGVTTRIRIYPTTLKQRLESLRDRELDKMERNLALLPGIANICTLLGLFGTVSGMITAFSAMTETGSSDPYVLAGGISRALVTTAAGLAAAIPALVAHHLFENLTDRHLEAMEEVVAEVNARAGERYAQRRENATS